MAPRIYLKLCNQHAKKALSKKKGVGAHSAYMCSCSCGGFLSPVLARREVSMCVYI